MRLDPANHSPTLTPSISHSIFSIPRPTPLCDSHTQLCENPFPAFLTPLNLLHFRNKERHPSRDAVNCCGQSPAKPKTVGIAGAGIAGLATALSLLRTPATGVEHVSIFEPRETLDTGLGGLLNINGGAAVLAKCYDIDLWKIGNQTKNVVARDTNGALLFQVDVQEQLDSMSAAKKLLCKDGRHMFMSVMRDSLQQLLYEAVKSDAVTFHRGPEWRVMDVKTENDKAFFVLSNDQRSENFDLVIGADGIHSKVRAFVTGMVTPPEYSGIRVQWAINPPGSCSLETNQLEQYFGDGGYALRYAAGSPNSLTEALALSFREDERSSENVTYSTESYVKGDMEKRLRKCRMPETVMGVFRNSTKFIDTSVYYHSSIPSWSKGICTLVGDSGMFLNLENGNTAVLSLIYICGAAVCQLTFLSVVLCLAHAMPPFLGQGANQAIQDAHALALTLSEVGTTYSGLSDALQQYETLRNGPTAALMQSSRFIGLLETQGGLLGTNVRNSIFRFAGFTGAVGQTFVQSATPRIPL